MGLLRISSEFDGMLFGFLEFRRISCISQNFPGGRSTYIYICNLDAHVARTSGLHSNTMSCGTTTSFIGANTLKTFKCRAGAGGAGVGGDAPRGASRIQAATVFHAFVYIYMYISVLFDSEADRGLKNTVKNL